jgi:hypothetical protein
MRRLTAVLVIVAVGFVATAILVPLSRRVMPGPAADWIAAILGLAVATAARHLIVRRFGEAVSPRPFAALRQERRRAMAALPPSRPVATGWGYAWVGVNLALIAAAVWLALSLRSGALPGFLHQPWASLIPLMRDAAIYNAAPASRGFTAVQSIAALAWWNMVVSLALLWLYVRSNGARLRAILATSPPPRTAQGLTPFFGLLFVLGGGALLLLLWGPAVIGVTGASGAVILIALGAFVFNMAIGAAVIITR